MARRGSGAIEAPGRVESPRGLEEADFMRVREKKRGMLVLGLMSGTSADGIDIALARISGAPPRVKARLINHTAVKFPARVRAEILRVAEQQGITAGEL